MLIQSQIPGWIFSAQGLEGWRCSGWFAGTRGGAGARQMPRNGGSWYIIWAHASPEHTEKHLKMIVPTEAFSSSCQMLFNKFQSSTSKMLGYKLKRVGTSRPCLQRKVFGINSLNGSAGKSEVILSYVALYCIHHYNRWWRSCCSLARSDCRRRRSQIYIYISVCLIVS